MVGNFIDAANKRRAFPKGRCTRGAAKMARYKGRSHRAATALTLWAAAAAAGAGLFVSRRALASACGRLSGIYCPYPAPANQGPDVYTNNSGTGSGDHNWFNNNNWASQVAPDNINTTATYAPSDTITPYLYLNGSATINSFTLGSGSTLNIGGGNTLTIAQSAGISNDGSITVNSDQSGNSILDFTFPNDDQIITGSGTVTLNAAGAGAQLNAATGTMLILDTQQTVQGQGQINANLANNGTINANVADGTLTLQTYDILNNSTIESTVAAAGGKGPGVLEIKGINVDQTGLSVPGQILADGGTVNIDGGATITGGTLTASNGGVINNFGGDNTLNGGFTTSGLTINGPFNILGDTNTAVSGTLTNNGTITVNSNQSGTSSLNFTDAVDQLLTGTGTVMLNASGGGAQLNSVSTLTIDTEQTVQGQGQINATIINNGLISANVDGQVLNVIGTATNNGTFLATQGGTLTVAPAALTNLSASTSTLTGGNYQVDANSTMNLTGPILTNQATVTLNGSSASFDALTSLNNNGMNGTLQLINGASFSTLGSLTTSGNIATDAVVNGTPIGVTTYFNNQPSVLTITGALVQTAGGTITDIGTIQALTTALKGGTLTGTGTVASAVTNSGGTIDPGYDVSPGKLTMSSLTQTSGGALDILLAAPGAGSTTGFSQLAITGNAFLGGSLDVTLSQGAPPSPANGTTYDILTSAALTGTFSSVTLPSNYSISYTKNDVVLLYGTAVPEPASLALLAVGALGLLTRRRRHAA